MQVLKFGGSSVAHAKNIQKVASIVARAVEADRTVVVVSAFSGITDALLTAGTQAAQADPLYRSTLSSIRHRHMEVVQELFNSQMNTDLIREITLRCNEIDDICNGIALLGELSHRVKDRLVSYGEWLSSRIISCYLESIHLTNEWVDARQLIITDDQYTKAAVLWDKTEERMLAFFNPPSCGLYLMPGFIAANEQGHATTLGRGGSDYTAAIVGAILRADPVEIWTDVPGMMTADPRLVPHARSIPSISFQEAMELCHFGAKVVYPPTIQPLMRRGIPVHVRNTFDPEHPATVIHAEGQDDGQMIRGISSISQLALVSLEGSGMVGIPGFSRRLFDALARHQINVIFITQASSEHTICVGVEEGHVHLAKIVVDEEFRSEIREGKVEPLQLELNLAIIALVGDHMKNHSGISGKMFSALGRNGVNIRAIAQGSSERNISAVINNADVKKAINVLHEEFFETVYKQVHVFIIGVGNVGRRLLEQLRLQRDYLQQQLGIQLRIAGLANSRQMCFDEKGIDLEHWSSSLQQGAAMDLDTFVQQMIGMNLRNSILVDVTANANVAGIYSTVLPRSISVVACNKIAASSPYIQYRQLKDLAREYNARFLFETNVGAGLPLINTLNDLVSSGDVVNRMEAVLSGTLNFVFNHYDGSRSFASVVRQAQEEGYTEPDPRLDLSGTDVMRKILILAREAGHALEMDEIENETFLPASCMEGSVDDFYREMEKEEEHFRRLLSEAITKGCKWKYVAKWEEGKACVGLQLIDPAHNLYHLYGKDNVVLFYTHRYPEQPLVIKGAGAGADVTASGVFADVVRAAI